MQTLSAVILLAGALAIAAWMIGSPLWRQRAPAPLDARIGERLLQTLPWRHLLDTGQRQRVATAGAQFLAQVRFVGCNGVAITDSMRVTVAAQAALLQLGGTAARFDLPREVLIYPDAFYIPQHEPDEHGLVNDAPLLASGEAWQTGRIVLSWADVEAALAGATDNVVLHEFAHLLDFAAPDTPGAPPDVDTARWAEVFDAAFEELRGHGSPVLDVYGSENPTEFFAVAVEAFFQCGPALISAHPALYRAIADYFGLDTARMPPRFADDTSR